MGQSAAVPAPLRDAAALGVLQTRLRGRRLVLAWIVGGAGASFYFGLFVVSLPGYVAKLQTRCLAPGLAADTSCMSGQFSPVAATTLQHLGVSLGVYAALTAAAFSRLSAFAQDQGVGPNNHVLLVLDQAGWHTSADLQIPDGLHLLFLPSHSPELQPAERLWPLSNEPLANRVLASLDELEQLQAERCRWLQAHPEVIRGRTSCHWWPACLNTA